MQDIQDYQQTEEYAKEEEKKEKIWQEKYGSKLNEVIEYMDSLLEKGTDESRQKLYEMFRNKEFFSNYKMTDVIAIMYLIMNIYNLEKKSNIFPTILECGKTVTELRRYWERLKFILYRIDFEIDSESEEELECYLRKYHTSEIVLEMLINTSVIHPMKLCLQLERIFENRRMYDYLLQIRIYINEHWQGNDRIVIKLAELYKFSGQKEYADKILSKVPDELRKIYEEEPITLQLQENLWKYHYQEISALKNIVDALHLNHINLKTWKILIENESVKSEEYYLQLADVFIKNNLLKYAVEVLKIGNDIIDDNKVLHILLDKFKVYMR